MPPYKFPSLWGSGGGMPSLPEPRLRPHYNFSLNKQLYSMPWDPVDRDPSDLEMADFAYRADNPTTWEKITAPLSDIGTRTGQRLAELPYRAGEAPGTPDFLRTPLMGTGAFIEGFGKETDNFFTSPLGIATMGGGVLAKGLQGATPLVRGIGQVGRAAEVGGSALVGGHGVHGMATAESPWDFGKGALETVLGGVGMYGGLMRNAGRQWGGSSQVPPPGPLPQVSEVGLANRPGPLRPRLGPGPGFLEGEIIPDTPPGGGGGFPGIRRGNPPAGPFDAPGTIQGEVLELGDGLPKAEGVYPDFSQPGPYPGAPRTFFGGRRGLGTSLEEAQDIGRAAQTPAEESFFASIPERFKPPAGMSNFGAKAPYEYVPQTDPTQGFSQAPVFTPPSRAELARFPKPAAQPTGIPPVTAGPGGAGGGGGLPSSPVPRFKQPQISAARIRSSGEQLPTSPVNQISQQVGATPAIPDVVATPPPVVPVPKAKRTRAKVPTGKETVPELVEQLQDVLKKQAPAPKAPPIKATQVEKVVETVEKLPSEQKIQAREQLAARVEASGDPVLAEKIRTGAYQVARDKSLLEDIKREVTAKKGVDQRTAPLEDTTVEPISPETEQIARRAEKAGNKDLAAQIRSGTAEIGDVEPLKAEVTPLKQENWPAPSAEHDNLRVATALEKMGSPKLAKQVLASKEKTQFKSKAQPGKGLTDNEVDIVAKMIVKNGGLPGAKPASKAKTAAPADKTTPGIVPKGEKPTPYENFTDSQVLDFARKENPLAITEAHRRRIDRQIRPVKDTADDVVKFRPRVPEKAKIEVDAEKALDDKVESILRESDPELVDDNLRNYEVERDWAKIHGTPDELEEAGILYDAARDRWNKLLAEKVGGVSEQLRGEQSLGKTPTASRLSRAKEQMKGLGKSAEAAPKKPGKKLQFGKREFFSERLKGEEGQLIIERKAKPPEDKIPDVSDDVSEYEKFVEGRPSKYIEDVGDVGTKEPPKTKKPKGTWKFGSQTTEKGTDIGSGFDPVEGAQRIFGAAKEGFGAAKKAYSKHGAPKVKKAKAAASKVVGDTASTIGAEAEGATARLFSSIPNAARALGQSGLTTLEKMGPGGKALARAIQKARISEEILADKYRRQGMSEHQADLRARDDVWEVHFRDTDFVPDKKTGQLKKTHDWDKLDEMIADTEDPKMAEAIVNKHFGRVPAPADRFAPFAKSIGGLETATKLSQFFISNIANIVMTASRSNAGAMMKSGAKMMKDYKAAVNEASKTGALRPIMNELRSEFGMSKRIGQVFGIEKAEEIQRTFASIAGKHTADELFAQIKAGKGGNTARRRLSELMLDEDLTQVLRQDKLTEAQRLLAGNRMSEITQGRAGSIDLPPIWTTHPIANLATQFKRYAFTQSKNIKDAMKIDPVRTIAGLAIAGGAIGEGVGDTKAIMNSFGQALIKDENLWKTMHKKIGERGEWKGTRMLQNYGDAWALGLMSDLVRSFGRGEGGFPGFIAGPLGQDIGRAGSSIWEGNRRELGRQAVEAVPFIGRGISQGLSRKEQPSRRQNPDFRTR